MSDAAVNEYTTLHGGTGLQLAGQGVDWVSHLRNQALEHFRTIGFPTAREETWKYTNVRPILKHSFAPTKLNGNEAVARTFMDSAIPRHQGPRLVFVNGHFSMQLSRVGTPVAGARLTNIASMLETDPVAAEPYLAHQTPDVVHGFTALNTAFIGDGAFVELAAGVELTQPIELLFVVTSSDRSVLAQPRNLVIAGPGSRVQIVERYAGADTSRYFTNAVTEIVAQNHAVVDHYKIQQEGTNAFHIGGLFVKQKKGSRLVAHSTSLGGAIVRNDVHVVLSESDSECTLNGLYLAVDRQHVDNQTHIDHRSPHTTSRESYKGILDGRARAVFQGRVVIHPDAQHSDAQQSNKNLLLSRNAEVDTKPQLEIYADDIKCAHGATVGQLDTDALFYMRSRGIAEEAARRLLIYAFAKDMIENMQLDSIRHELEEAIAVKLLHRKSLEELL